MPPKTRKRPEKVSRGGGAKIAGPMAVQRFIRYAPSSRWNIVDKSGLVDLANGGLTTVSTPALGGVSYSAVGLGFSLNDLAGASDFTTLFDQYKITKVQLEMVPFFNQAPSAVTSGNGNVAAVVHSAIDLDDNASPTAAPAGVETLMERPTYRCDNVVDTRTLRWELAPKVALAAYAAGAFTSYAVLEPQWIDVASPAVAHYGFKFLFEVVNPSSVACFLNFRWTARIHLEMRSVR